MYRMFENIYVKYETFYYSQLATPVQIKLMQIITTDWKMKKKYLAEADKNYNHLKEEMKCQWKMFRWQQKWRGLGLVGTF